MLHHFIRPQFLKALLETRAFHLIRQDKQSDPDDGKLPAACFADPHIGPLENGLGLKRDFLANQAHALAHLHRRTFIMSWTSEASDHMRQNYGESGSRCELQTSELGLKSMLGYEWLRDQWGGVNEFPPRPEKVGEIHGALAHAQLTEPVYTPGTAAIPVIPTYGATAHKHDRYSVESEIRIEAVVSPESLQLGGHDTLIRWPIKTFDGLRIGIGAKVESQIGSEITALAAKLGISVHA